MDSYSMDIVVKCDAAHVAPKNTAKPVVGLVSHIWSHCLLQSQAMSHVQGIMGAHPYQVLPLTSTADIGSALALLTGKVKPFAHPPTSMRHDPQPRLQDSSHHCNVGAVP